jgi:uncharacterized protein
MTENEKAILITKNWIETFVLGLNLCPFARHPYRNDKIRYVVFEGDDMTQLGEFLVKEMHILDETSPSIIETTLIVLRDTLTNFDEYLEILYALEELLNQLEYDGVYQLVSFHPDYLFEESEPTDVENYTNRSPYPMLHLLREDSVSRTIEAFPEVGDIIERNQDTMNKIGLLAIKKMFDDVFKTT